MDRRPDAGPIAALGWPLAAIVAGTISMDSHWAHANYWDEPTMVIFWRTSLGVFFLCVLAAAAHLPHFAESWPLRPVRYLGEVSYGIYPWHLFAIEVCLKIADITPVQALGTTLGLSVLLAATSWHLLEKPILDRPRRFGGGILPQERGHLRTV